MKIGELALAAQTQVETIRYYERLGLLKPILRKDSGYRVYDEKAVKVIRFIKHAQELGFSLEEISGLLKLRADTKAKCSGVQKQAIKHLADVDKKLSKLKRIRSSLLEMISKCQARKTETDCPLLDCLDTNKE